MSSINAPETLRPEHNTANFDCGKAPLNEFLKRHALDKGNAMLSRTYVVTSDMEVVGYYTLAHTTVEQAEAPKKMGRGMPSSIPVMLMARFAVDNRFQGRGLGRSLLLDALRRTCAVIESGAAPVRLFVVDAKDEDAKAFYERFDMIAAPSNALRLYLSYKSVRALFEETGAQPSDAP